MTIFLLLNLLISFKKVFSGNPLVCPKPPGWCSGKGEDYFRKDVGKYDIPVCANGITGRFGEIIRINDKCVDLYPRLIYPQTEANVITNCEIPKNWCTDDDAYLDIQICDGERMIPTCWTKKSGKFGQLIMANEQCIDTWPNGWDNKCATNIQMDCIPPKGWCPPSEANLILRPCQSLDFYLPTCVGKDGVNKYGELIRENVGGKCKSTWPHGTNGCDTDVKVVCKRPKNWCKGPGETFGYQDCANSFRIPTCYSKTKYAQLLNVNGRCRDTGPNSLQSCDQRIRVECDRPKKGWCEAQDDIFQYLECGDKYVPTCFNRKNKNQFGQIIRKNGKCIDTWPSGNDICLSGGKVNSGLTKDYGFENNKFEWEYINIMIFVVGISISIFMLAGACYFIKNTWSGVSTRKKLYTKVASSDATVHV